MFVTKNISFWRLLGFTWFHLVWLTLWGCIAVTLYHTLGIHWLGIPWLPVSVIGIAVSFFVGFKNNSSYGRMWEARIIWGAIVNYSRSWGAGVKSYIPDESNSEEVKAIKKRLIKRHIAWLYVLRAQLLRPTQWEHSQLGGGVGKLNQRRRKKLLQDEENITIREELEEFMPEEAHEFCQFKNPATHMLDKQSQDLQELREKGLLSDYRFVELQKIVQKFYDEQGKSERIKGYPFPRQYATGSAYFIGIFILLLPFGMLTEFEKLREELIWLTVPFVTLVGWVFILMELIGDYSENPFQGLPNDIPLKSICRTIEIDLLEMIGDEDVPDKLADHRGILM